MRTRPLILFLLVLGVCVSPIFASAPYGLDSRAPIGSFLNGTLPPALAPSGSWTAAKVFPNLTFPDPIGLLAVPRNTNRLCVYTRGGFVYTFDRSPEPTTKTLVLDLSAVTQSWDDCGLLGMAFHPQFGNPASANRGYFYVYYQYSPTPTPGPNRPPRNTPAFNRLSRFTIPDGSSVADPGSELVLINQYDENVWHNGGGMFFHPSDGFLYLSNGDEGGENGEFGNTQRIDRDLFAGVMRIDVDRDPIKSHPIRRQPVTETNQPLSFTANYYVPNDNPFVDPSGSVLEEFWCIGVRSPHRMTVDPPTGQVWLGDVGQGLREEINLIEKGGNYQWAFMEGSLIGPIAKPVTVIGTEKPPIYEYYRNNGDNAVIGGYVYRGSLFAIELGGKYIFGDNGTGRIWSLATNNGAPPTITYLCNMPAGNGYNGLTGFGVDHAGEIFMCKMGADGGIFQLTRPSAGSPQPPALLSQVGAFANLGSLTPATGLIPFDVNSPLWSDGAAKTRWMALPNDGSPYGTNEQVGFAPTGEWSFPQGTVFVKHFELGLNETNAAIRKRLETRFLARDTNGFVYGITYKWRDDGSDADLLDAAVSEELSILSATPVGAFTSMDIGNPTMGNTTFNSGDGSYTITAGGVDVWGNADQFRFAYQQRTGDFDVKARIESLTLVDGYTKAGLMARESLAPGSRHIDASAFADNRPRGGNSGGYEFIYRQDTDGPTFAIDPTFPQPLVAYPNTWIRLRREGNTFTAFASTNGLIWNAFDTYTLALPNTIYVGMAVTAHDATQTTTAKLLDFANNTRHTHFYPSRQDCLTCHNPNANHILGVKTHQLNGNFLYPQTGRTDNQLRTWSHLGLFNPAIDENSISNYARLYAVTNSSASSEDRVRSYLAANCSQCHRPNGVVRANFDARFETPLSQQNIVNGVVNETLNVVAAKVVSPGSLSKSIMYRRINTTDPLIRMPPLARNHIDQSAVNVFAEWISGLAGSYNNFGLRGEYYDNMDFTALKLTRTDPNIDFDWSFGAPHPAVGADTFSVRWTGAVQPAYSELYTFYTTSDDGVRLWVNGQLVVDDWTDHPPTEDSGTIALQAGQRCDLQMDYYENGERAVAKLAWSSPSQQKETIPSSRLTPRVEDWLDQDIGTVGLPGFALRTNRTFSLAASGADIENFADAFHYVYQPLKGDGQITARVASLEPTDGWAKAGVMIRENADPDSAHALMVITPANASAFQRRTASGLATLSTGRGPASAPYWVRLTRAGALFTGSISSNGVNWVVVDSQSIAMATNVLAGLALTAHNDAAINHALFTDVNVTSTFPAPVIASINRLIDGKIRVTLSPATLATYALQGTTNFQNWNTLSTFATTNGALQFLDVNAPTLRYRFYRIVAEP